ncbi:MAG: dihydropteroate synthase [Bacteroidota bacterium]
MFTLNCKGRLITAARPVVMGIINITPDSFYAGSRQQDTDQIVKKAEQMLKDGAAILDIGGQSTRPGSHLLTAEEELARIIVPIAAIHKQIPEAVISVDTFYAKVAAEAVAAGASVVNDISAGEMDTAMLITVAMLKVPYICMHMKGTPQTMQQHARYKDVTKEVLDFFIEKSATCKKAGIHDVIIDPGFGFAKNTVQNFTLLKNLNILKIMGKPVLAGLSRKASIYKTLGVTANEALNGTTVLNTIALQNGADILRVHDVKEAAETIKLFCAYAGA